MISSFLCRPMEWNSAAPVSEEDASVPPEFPTAPAPAPAPAPSPPRLSPDVSYWMD